MAPLGALSQGKGKLSVQDEQNFLPGCTYDVLSKKKSSNQDLAHASRVKGEKNLRYTNFNARGLLPSR